MIRQPFNHDWRFKLYDGKPLSWWRQPDYSTWRTLDLPHDWSIELPRNPNSLSGSSGGYFPTGRGWYRKTFTPPEEWRGKKVYLEFEGVYMNAEVWLNEHYLGRHPYGYTSFHMELTDALEFGKENALRVQVDNASEPNSRWYSGSGIYRPVWLLVADPIHVAPWGVYVTTPQVTPQAALVQIRTRVLNQRESDHTVTLRSRILSPSGEQVALAESATSILAGGEHEYAQALKVTDPRLWSLESPHLYRLETGVWVDGTLVDSATTTFGIRSLEFDPEKGFLLNGQPVLLKGGCVHHDNGVLGSTSFARAEERKVEIHKASGFNAIRCAHNPPAPAFLDACDRLGMLIIDEAFDCWREGKNPYDYHVVFEDWWQRDLDSMVLRDRNHPSVIMWSIGNEVLERDGRSGGAQVAAMLANRVRQLDPTRPVTAAICDIWGSDGKYTWESTDVVFASLDVGGYNYQWKQYRPDHERHPRRMMIGTESFPMEALDNWNLVEEESYVLGDFVWTSLDYLGEAGIGRVEYGEPIASFLPGYPWHQANCGDLDLCGFKRPQSYYRDIVWKTGTRLYIAVHTPAPEGKEAHISRWGWPDVWPNWNWPGHEGQPFKVDIYSACEQVELFLNGRSLGVKPSGKAERYTATFEVPYEPGQLRAVGLEGGKPVAEAVVETCGEAAALRLTPDRSSLRAADDDLSYITVEIVDAAGRVHPAADRPVFFTVQGEGVLAAVGSANPVSEEPYRGNMRTPYRGRGLVVVRTTGKPGEITLRAHADGLAPAEVTLKAS